jgi:hypothetical protein
MARMGKQEEGGEFMAGLELLFSGFQFVIATAFHPR